MNPPAKQLLFEKFPILWNFKHPQTRTHNLRYKAKLAFLKECVEKFGVAYTFKDVCRWIDSIQRKEKRKEKRKAVSIFLR